ncbi:dTDP-4-amino-4,6-dideoxygalactose transaminase [Alteromonas sp. Mex14]|nr:dTDP-4-amino-4,6-dideoxygalactose transaminase [Alteromonas sp. Mex14]
MNIPFNKAPVVGNEASYINSVISSKKMCGGGLYSKKCEELLEELTGTQKALLTPSCTAALELAALMLDITHGDEVIMPSYTFVSTANAFALRGAKIIFVDVDPKTMNIDPKRIEAAITPNTKAIVPVHYAGVACDMDAIMALASTYNLFVVEDAAQAIGSYHSGKALGTIGHFGTFSFHETKNITSGGEGGALLVNDESFIARAEIIREKGTNRSQFFRGSVDKYSWVDIGSSYLPSEIQAAYLYGQLLNLDKINQSRFKSWNIYFEHLAYLEEEKSITLPFIPEYATNNAHMFYIRCSDLKQRSDLINHLKQNGIVAVFHYIPLHSSRAGKELGEFIGQDLYTTPESEKLLRLPLYFDMQEEIHKVIEQVRLFFTSEKS